MGICLCTCISYSGNEFKRKNENKTCECYEMFSHTKCANFPCTIWSCKCLLGGVLCTMYGRFLFFFIFMVKQIFLPSSRKTPFLLGLFVSSSKQNLHEKKINGSLGKICVNINSSSDRVVCNGRYNFFSFTDIQLLEITTKKMVDERRRFSRSFEK